MSVEKVRAKLGEDAELFDFYEENSYIVAKPKQKIDTEDFKRIAKTLKQFGADYVRYNYKSKTGGLFHVKKEGMSTVTSDKKALLIKDIFAYADNIEMVARDMEKQAGIIKEKLKELQT